MFFGTQKRVLSPSKSTESGSPLKRQKTASIVSSPSRAPLTPRASSKHDEISAVEVSETRGAGKKGKVYFKSLESSNAEFVRLSNKFFICSLRNAVDSCNLKAERADRERELMRESERTLMVLKERIRVKEFALAMHAAGHTLTVKSILDAYYASSPGSANP